jgi:hypothetical protein
MSQSAYPNSSLIAAQKGRERRDYLEVQPELYLEAAREVRVQLDHMHLAIATTAVDGSLLGEVR